MDNRLRVGVITTTHGIKGEVKVFPTTDDVNRFLKQFEQSKKMMKQMSGMMGGKKRGGFKLPFGLR